MSGRGDGRDTALRVADRLRGAPGPWEVFGMHGRRFELYLQKSRVETVRGPIEAEGYGIRRFRVDGGTTAVGFQASTDLSDDGIRSAFDSAGSLLAYSSFPAPKLTLPTDRVDDTSGLEILDPGLWEDPEKQLEEYGAGLLREFAPLRDVVPTFGAVRAILEEVSLANSAGGETRYRGTAVELETMVKASGGPEGKPPGEYWTNGLRRRLDPGRAATDVAEWTRHARAVRDARPSPTGSLPVILPPDVLADVVPTPIGSRLSGFGRLRRIAPEVGSDVAAPIVTIHDDGILPWAASSRPADGEGTRQRRTTLVDHGKLSAILYDALHAGAFDVPATGNAIRGFRLGRDDWLAFRHSPSVGPTTVSIAPGTAGSAEELIEATKDGLWIQQIGFPNPDPLTSAFGGEIRVGYRIRGGKIAEPVRGGTVGGVVLATPGSPSLLANIAAIGSRAELAGSIHSPPVLVRTLAVAGDSAPATG
jgi:predicted Zn-dependent protease